ncbi:hypothetical protein EJ02DRAFT_391409 [Clathrospora elynae]|uniref:Rhodopsin domain-containing protein n=1 Tax=Clathrospora elynae TaxID=706981 RepID=A0A6A5TGF1_9PLEO|nr:hypothetical protein EJ02DRAFT_391409 [Clathrospora elynae]
MSAKTNGFAQGTVLSITYSMLGFTTFVVLARVGLNILRPKRLTASDYFVFLAFAFYVIMCALYISVSPYMQRVYAVINGETPPYATMKEDAVVMTKMIFAAPCMFYLTLWSIKLSLLFLYRKLLIGISKQYIVIWWGIAGFCVLTFGGNYIMYFRSCGTISGFWMGGCIGDTAKHAQLASLYYSFAVDIATNLMIMALPIKLTWNLQMPRSKKIAILILFGSGIVCILFACLRVSQVAVNAANPESDGQPLDPTWISIWGVVECSIAVSIGCCPAFAVLVKAFHSKTTHDSRGYRKQTDSQSGRNGGSKIQFSDIGSTATRSRDQQLGLDTSDSHWADAHSSQEKLRVNHDGILVSTTVTQKEGSATVFEVR